MIYVLNVNVYYQQLLIPRTAVAFLIYFPAPDRDDWLFTFKLLVQASVMFGLVH